MPINSKKIADLKNSKNMLLSTKTFMVIFSSGQLPKQMIVLRMLKQMIVLRMLKQMTVRRMLKSKIYIYLYFVLCFILYYFLVFNNKLANCKVLLYFSVKLVMVSKKDTCAFYKKRDKLQNII